MGGQPLQKLSPLSLGSQRRSAEGGGLSVGDPAHRLELALMGTKSRVKIREKEAEESSAKQNNDALLLGPAFCGDVYCRYGSKNRLWSL